MNVFIGAQAEEAIHLAVVALESAGQQPERDTLISEVSAAFRSAVFTCLPEYVPRDKLTFEIESSDTPFYTGGVQWRMRVGTFGEHYPWSCAFGVADPQQWRTEREKMQATTNRQAYWLASKYR